MAAHDVALLAGSASTTLFVSSSVPMVVRAARTRDLSSYSPTNLVLSNIGNAVYAVYVVSLPVGPVWVLHGFWSLTSLFMLTWWWRCRPPRGQAARPTASRTAYATSNSPVARSTGTRAGPVAPSRTGRRPRYASGTERRARSAQG